MDDKLVAKLKKALSEKPKEYYPFYLHHRLNDNNFVYVDTDGAYDSNSMYPYMMKGGNKMDNKCYDVKVNENESLIISDVQKMEFNSGALSFYDSDNEMTAHFPRDSYQYFSLAGS